MTSKAIRGELYQYLQEAGIDLIKHRKNVKKFLMRHEAEKIKDNERLHQENRQLYLQVQQLKNKIAKLEKPSGIFAIPRNVRQLYK